MPLDPNTLDRLAAMLRGGATNREAVLALGIDKQTAARYRAALGIGPAPKQPAPNRSTLTLAEKFATFTRPIEGGHLEWTGNRKRQTNTPVFTHRERLYTARSVAFRIGKGRDPQGYVTAECDYPGCVAPQCVEDEPGRTAVRDSLAKVIGTATNLAECGRGHATAEHRRYDRGGNPYCGTCHADAKRARQAAA
jgi:hypothetical protein